MGLDFLGALQQRLDLGALAPFQGLADRDHVKVTMRPVLDRFPAFRRRCPDHCLLPDCAHYWKRIVIQVSRRRTGCYIADNRLSMRTKDARKGTASTLVDFLIILRDWDGLPDCSRGSRPNVLPEPPGPESTWRLHGAVDKRGGGATPPS